MVDVGMKSVPPRVIERKVCLWAKSSLGLSKDFRPKRCPNIWRKEESKKTKEFRKAKEGGV